MIWRFCQGRIHTALLLSPLVLLAPLAGNYLVRKDSMTLALFGLSLLAIQVSRNRRWGIGRCATIVNGFSILALLSHETYGLWALPGLLLVLDLARPEANRLAFRALFRSAWFLLPSILTFGACILFKGSAEKAAVIHRSWQALGDVMPSLGALGLDSPPGAISALGWSLAEGARWSLSVANDFSFFVWVPAAWLGTIYLSMNLFVAGGRNSTRNDRRSIIIFQAGCISPLFIMGWDFGRWIFILMATSSLLYGFLSSLPEIGLPEKRWAGRERELGLLLPGLELRRGWIYGLLFLGIPHCCWTITEFFNSSPLGYAIIVLKGWVAVVR